MHCIIEIGWVNRKVLLVAKFNWHADVLEYHICILNLKLDMFENHKKDYLLIKGKTILSVEFNVSNFNNKIYNYKVFTEVPRINQVFTKLSTVFKNFHFIILVYTKHWLKQNRVVPRTHYTQHNSITNKKKICFTPCFYKH